VGDTFPDGPTPIWPPDEWICPPKDGGCGKTHTKPHFEWPGQIDHSKPPGKEGRILFNRVSKDENLADDTPIKKKLIDKQAPMLDKKGHPKALTCPHCGYTQDGILLIKVKKKRRKLL
jgi:hypothetical protein